MLPIVDAPAIQYVVEEIVATGIEDVIIVTSANKTAIEDYFDRSPDLEHALEQKGSLELLQQVRYVGEMANVHYVRQKEPLGLGHAILCARMHIGDEPFAVVLPDDLIVHQPSALQQLLDAYQDVGPVVAVQQVPRQDVSKYGIIAGRLVANSDEAKADCRLYRVNDLIEKPSPDLTPSELGVIGRYVLDPEIFDFLTEGEAGYGGEIQLTDALRRAAQGRGLHALIVKGERFDIGDKVGWLTANLRFALERPDLAQQVLRVAEQRWSEFATARDHSRQGMSG